MDKKTLEALRGSIKKWQDIVKGVGEDDGVDNCPLCQLFNTEEMTNDDACVGCPVMNKTEYDGCQNTPYDKWVDYVCYDEQQRVPFKAKSNRAIRLAKKELKFLISLLPEGEKP